MLWLFIILLSIWFNHIWLINNEAFILAIFLIIFFLVIYIFMSFFIKLYFFKNISNILNLLKYSNVLELYLDKVLYYNLTVKILFFKNILKNKNKLINFLNFIDNKINNFLFFNILNFFLSIKKNLFKLLKNKKLLFIKKNISGCVII